MEGRQPDGADHRAAAQIALEHVVELAGATGAEAAHPACVCSGARRCEYQVLWTAAE